MWMVSWSHPNFGSKLASCGNDHRVCIWKEESKGKWDLEHTHTVEGASGIFLLYAKLHGLMRLYTFSE